MENYFTKILKYQETKLTDAFGLDKYREALEEQFPIGKIVFYNENYNLVVESTDVDIDTNGENYLVVTIKFKDRISLEKYGISFYESLRAVDENKNNERFIKGFMITATSRIKEGLEKKFGKSGSSYGMEL